MTYTRLTKHIAKGKIMYSKFSKKFENKMRAGMKYLSNKKTQLYKNHKSSEVINIIRLVVCLFFVAMAIYYGVIVVLYGVVLALLGLIIYFLVPTDYVENTVIPALPSASSAPKKAPVKKAPVKKAPAKKSSPAKKKAAPSKAAPKSK